MDFSKLFPDAKNQDYTHERIGNTLLSNTHFSTIQKFPVQDAIWIDGGSATLVSTPTRAIALIKVCTITTKGMHRDEINIQTSIVSITAQEDLFVIRQIPLQQETKTKHDILIDVPEQITRKELADEQSILTPAALIDVIRATAEHNLANTLAQKDTNFAIILDGSIRSTTPYLQQWIPHKNITAVAKTSNILTSNARPFAVAISKKAPNTSWIAHIANSCCAKLHHASKHIFLIEGNNDNKVISTLESWSTDVAFTGYPYPLILVDQLARVTNNERDMWRTQLSAANISELQDELHSTDAHDVLEHILYGKQGF